MHKTITSMRASGFQLNNFSMGRLRQFFLLLFFSCYAMTTVYAQDPITVSGTVVDENGVPLPYVTVSVAGTTNGTATNEQGEYSIRISEPNPVLVFSYIGYQTQEIPVNGNTNIDVSLQPDMSNLDEIVVVGYGTQRKSDLTGAISSISEEEIKNQAVSNVSQLLQGKAAGVHVASSSGQPGSSAVVRIRGFGTVNDNNPLYVVDGQFFDNINNLNPNDIASIEVLKDASSTSIYGSRGSNGVILITTKSGKEGVHQAAFDAYVGVKDSYDPPNMMNSEQFFEFTKLAYENAGQELNPLFEEQYNRGFDTDWWEAVNRTALTQNYNFSFRKGSENYRSYLSLGYLDEEGPIITTEFSRISVKLNNEYDVTSRFTVGANLGIAKNESSDANSLPRFDFILQADPFTPVINPLVDPSDPNYRYNKYAPTEYAFNPNPVSYLELNDRQSEDFNFFGNVHARLELLEDLNYTVQLNYEHNNNRFKLFQPTYESIFSEYNLANRASKSRDVSTITNNSSVSKDYLIEQRLNYAGEFGDHNVDVMLATTYEENTFESINAFKTDTPGNSISFRVLGAATEGDRVSGGKLVTSILSYLGRVNYNYADRYLATVNFRADGSSRFAEGNRWGYFPSFSLGWRVDKEDFFEDLDLNETLTNFKIRAGWGRTGNQRINSYAPLTLIGTAPDRQYNFGGGYSQGFIPTNVGNPDIVWETSEQTNIGFDAGLFNNRLSVNFNYYIKETEDMLLRVPIPAIAGYPNYPYSNAGSVENRGFELHLNYQNTINEFYYSFGGNISKYKNEVTSLGNGGLPLFGAVSRTEVGGPMSRFYGYVWEGIFQNTAEIENYVGPSGELIQPNATPGDFKFADLNDDGVINDADRTYIGNPHPDLVYRFNFNLQYGSFDLIGSFQGIIGNDIYNGLKTLAIPGQQNNLAAAYTDAWMEEGDNATYPKPSLGNANNNYRASTWWVEDGSYLRLQNIQLGYNLHPDLLERTFFDSFRIYLSGQNLLTFTDYTGSDPEIGSFDPLDLGYDNIRYPSSRTYMVGINTQF